MCRRRDPFVTSPAPHRLCSSVKWSSEMFQRVDADVLRHSWWPTTLTSFIEGVFMRMDNTAIALVLIATLLPEVTSAQTPKPAQDPQQNSQQNPPLAPPTFHDTVQVTATRFGEPVAEVPGSISVVTGEEIRARGATDLRTALALLGGVSVAPGGDAGPAGAVPGLLGVREVDDLLLLIDGIPAGGAFIPQIEAISLNNVERIEVMRGAAPVYFGTTAFAGTINVIHYAAGSADRATGVHFGSY